MKLLLFPFLAVTLLLGGCDVYTGPTQVSGTVVDVHTRQPVPNALVQVLGASTSVSTTSPGGIVQAKTDASGRYSLSFEARAHELYQLQAFSASGYSPLSTPYVDGGRKTDNVEVFVSAPAWVKINCVDDPPASRVGLTTSGYSYGANGVGDNQTIGPNGFSFVRPTRSYVSDSVYWRINNEMGQVTQGWLKYRVTSFDTATVTIHF